MKQKSGTHAFSARPLLWVLVLLGVFGADTLVAADLVTPSARVVTALNVRAAATANAAVVGKLRPGDAALLTGDVSAWYRVTLPDGVVGYVSKAWSSLEADLRLGEWNLKKLGHGSSKDFVTVAAIIEEHYDVLAVVEVMQKDQKHAGYDTLLHTLGAAWSGMVTETPRPNTHAGDAEFYAIVFRTDVVRPCPEGPAAMQYVIDNDGGPQGVGDNNFVREPAFACFETIADSGGRGWDFILGAFHATWADGNEDAIVAEASHLTDVFSAMKAARPGEADVFLAGDFNLVPDILREHITAADRTEGTGSTLNSKGGRTPNLYDHLLVLDPRASSELVVEAAVLDVRNKAASEKAFYTTVSDHLPIVGHFMRNRADDD